MNIERLIALIVKTVVEELTRQGLIQVSKGPDPEHPARTDTLSPAPSAPIKSRRRVISEEIIMEAVRMGTTEIEIASDALVTPLAHDTAKEKGVAIKRV